MWKRWAIVLTAGLALSGCKKQPNDAFSDLHPDAKDVKCEFAGGSGDGRDVYFCNFKGPYRRLLLSNEEPEMRDMFLVLDHWVDDKGEDQWRTRAGN